MCGRYASFRSDADLAKAFQVAEVVEPDAVPPSWNVAPQQDVRVVLDRAPKGDPAAKKRQLRTARWGLVPPWASDPSIGNRMINARSETILDKPAFRAAARHHRLILPAEGYYEWQKLDAAGKRKQPWYLTAPDGAPLAFAGLYEWRKDPDLAPDDPAAWLWTCTIMTTTASDELGHVHDRSPVIVPAALLDDWLDPAITDPDEIRTLVAAMPEPRLAPRPVGRAVGSVRNDGPGLIEPVEPERPDGD
ncbi:MAG: SOS response-associated peptidase [Actinomycetota bacterium]